MDLKLFNSPIKILGGVVILVEGILTLILTKCDPSESQKTIIICGMILLMFSTIAAALAMQWMSRKKEVSGDGNTGEHQIHYVYDVFISFPIAGASDKKKREEINVFANKLEAELKKLGYRKIFNASIHFSHKHEHEPPKIAAQTDFRAIDESRNFLLLYPEKMPTSALIELGYALAKNRNVVMCSDNSHTLPFLARGFTDAFENVNFIEYADNQHLLDVLVENHLRYFKQEKTE